MEKKKFSVAALGALFLTAALTGCNPFAEKEKQTTPAPQAQKPEQPVAGGELLPTAPPARPAPETPPEPEIPTSAEVEQDRKALDILDRVTQARDLLPPNFDSQAWSDLTSQIHNLPTREDIFKTLKSEDLGPEDQYTVWRNAKKALQDLQSILTVKPMKTLETLNKDSDEKNTQANLDEGKALLAVYLGAINENLKTAPEFQKQLYGAKALIHVLRVNDGRNRLAGLDNETDEGSSVLDLLSKAGSAEMLKTRLSEEEPDFLKAQKTLMAHTLKDLGRYDLTDIVNEMPEYFKEDETNPYTGLNLADLEAGATLLKRYSAAIDAALKPAPQPALTL